jgi:hypothetical protein
MGVILADQTGLGLPEEGDLQIWGKRGRGGAPRVRTTSTQFHQMSQLVRHRGGQPPTNPRAQASRLASAWPVPDRLARCLAGSAAWQAWRTRLPAAITS